MNKLLAPNGKPSNLNAKQYKLVRTPAFKKWFGDFENQYKSTLIKIVDGKLIYDGIDVGIFEITKKLDRVEIDRLYIDKEFQKKGIGKACIQYLFNNYKIDLVELYPHPYTQSFWLNNGVVNVRKDGFFEIDNQKYSVSKVVDENGEPLVVFHGTNEKFTTFDKKYIGLNYIQSKQGGFFFTEKKKSAENYAKLHSKLKSKGFLYNCFLNLKNPIISKTNSDYYSPADYYDIHRGDFLSVFYEDDDDDFEDGVIILGTKEDNLYVVKNPNQIKLADGTNTTFDIDNPDIRFNIGGEVNTGLFSQIWKWFGIKF